MKPPGLMSDIINCIAGLRDWIVDDCVWFVGYVGFMGFHYPKGELGSQHLSLAVWDSDL